MASLAFRGALKAHARPSLRAFTQSSGFFPLTKLQYDGPLHQTRGAAYVPTILQPSFWRSLVPKSLRRGQEEQGGVPRRKPWNPATFYIWMFLLIGSQSIQMLTMRGQFAKYTQETEEKLELLRGVIRKIKNGEDVDVQAVLGTGNAQKEKEWEEVMKELENEDKLFNETRKSKQPATASDATASSAA